MTTSKRLPFKKTRILVIGLGSMGKRRLRLLTKFFPNIEIAGVDSRIDRRNEVLCKFNCPVFENFDESFLTFKPNAVIISTSPESHGILTTACLKLGLHVFSELDLLDDEYDTILSFERNPFPVVFLSSTMLFRAEIRWIIDNHRDIGEKKFYCYHVGQYLPDWHVWEKYDDFFVSSPKTNAIRELLCLELPWLVRCFGEIVEYSCHWGQTSSLRLFYPDTCHILIRHSNNVMGVLIVDCVSRKATREMRIDGEDGMIRWNGRKDSLQFIPPSGRPIFPLAEEKELSHEKEYADIISEEPYLEELRLFFDIINGRIEKCKGYSYFEHKKILDFVNQLESGWKK